MSKKNYTLVLCFFKLYAQSTFTTQFKRADQYLILGADSDTDIRRLYILISIYPLESTCVGDDVSQRQDVLLFIKKLKLHQCTEIVNSAGNSNNPKPVFLNDNLYKKLSNWGISGNTNANTDALYL